MPKIIGQDKNRQAKCGKCGAKMTFTLDEVRAGKPIEGYDYYDDDYTSVITCPNCGKSINVTSKVGPTDKQTAQRQFRDDDYY